MSTAPVRENVLGGDLDAMEPQAHRAEEEGALIGLDRAEVRGVLGEPERRSRRDTVWTWDLGMVDDGLGPGDGGGFRVRFDGATGPARSAAVEPTGR